MRQIGFAVLAMALGLAACDAGPAGDTGPDNAATTAAANTTSAAAGDSAPPALAACPFRETSDWHGSITNGRLLVNGKVDLLMAGFTPTLTPRKPAPPDTFAFDLALVPQTGAVVAERARYEAATPARHRHAEVYCGGARIAAFDVVLVEG